MSVTSPMGVRKITGVIVGILSGAICRLGMALVRMLGVNFGIFEGERFFFVCGSTIF